MPFFKKTEEKKINATVDYPRQEPPSNGRFASEIYPQGVFVQQNVSINQTTVPVVPNTVTHVGITRYNQPNGLLDTFFDGPDFCNKVRDPRIPPAPGSYVVVSNVSQYATSSYPFVSSTSSAPSYLQSSSSRELNNVPPPPSYEEVLSREMKRNM